MRSPERVSLAARFRRQIRPHDLPPPAVSANRIVFSHVFFEVTHAKFERSKLFGFEAFYFQRTRKHRSSHRTHVISAILLDWSEPAEMFLSFEIRNSCSHRDASLFSFNVFRRVVRRAAARCVAVQC